MGRVVYGNLFKRVEALYEKMASADVMNGIIGIFDWFWTIEYCPVC